MRWMQNSILIRLLASMMTREFMEQPSCFAALVIVCSFDYLVSADIHDMDLVLY